jgi:hypothetical protein
MSEAYAQRIANLVQSLNMQLDAAAGDGYTVHVYLLPSAVLDQDNPTIGVRLCKPDEQVSENVVWIGMAVPHAED